MFSKRLRDAGVDCTIDQYEESPEAGWPTWCQENVERAAFVIVVCSELYARRYAGNDVSGRGGGAAWEGYIITQELYNAQGRNGKFIPVIFGSSDEIYIPLTLQGVTRYNLAEESSYQLLYRRLTGQPWITAPSLGLRHTLPPRSIPDVHSGTSSERESALPPFNLPYGAEVPHARNKLFTGREQLLTETHSLLQSTGAAAICGLGGIGKTQMAIEYAYRWRGEYKGIFWAKADSRELLLASYVAIAAKLNLSEAAATEQRMVVSALKQWLADRVGWLLILDNADDLEMVSDFFPFERRGCVLLTTRAHATGRLAGRIDVDEMPVQEGVLFLLRRAGLASADSSLSAVEENDVRIAERITRELGGLPLALDQAGAFIEETPSSLAEFESLYAQEGERLRAASFDSTDKHPPVSVTFSLAFQSVVNASEAAGILIQLCSFLGSEGIPEELFIKGAKELPVRFQSVAAKQFDFTQLIRVCARFSLIHRDARKQTLTIHRLVQAVVRDSMTSTERRNWAECATRVVNRSFPDGEFENWSMCERLLAHVQTCAALIEAFDFHFPEAGSLLGRAGSYLHRRARYAEAEPLCRRALKIRETEFGTEHLEVATSLTDLARIFDIECRFNEAEPLFRKALDIRNRVLAPDHADIATSLNDLADLYYAQGRYKEAEPLYLQALDLRQNILPADHPELAISLNSVARMYQAQGDFEKARPLYNNALEIRKSRFGVNHPSFATSLHDIAELYTAEHKYNQAEPLYRTALLIRERELGPEHPDVAVSLNGLACLLYDKREDDKAECLFKKAIAIWESAHGRYHPTVAACLNNIGNLYYSQCKYQEAEGLYRRALEICERAFSKDHLRISTCFTNIGNLLYATGRYKEAEPLYQRALQICEKALNGNHARVSKCLNNLAGVLYAEARYSDAEPLYLRTVSIAEESLGKDHPNVAIGLNNLAGVYCARGMYEVAERLHRRALELREGTFGSGDAQVAASFHNLAALYARMQRYSQSEVFFRRALAIREGYSNLHDVGTSLLGLADVLRTQNRLTEAKDVLARVEGIFGTPENSKQPEAITLLIRRAELYYDEADYGRAEAIYVRALGGMEELLGKEHPLLAEPLAGFSRVLQGQRRFSEAINVLLRSLEVRRAMFSDRHPEVLRDAQNLILLYESQGQYAEAAEIRSRMALA